MRPTGRLHIGHYYGALQNWVRLQSDPANECFYFVADWHALTSDYADTSAIAENSLQITIDYLASGLDPEISVLFLQSQVPEHAELHLLLSMITPLGWLERIPTYKEQIENITNKDLHTYGFLGYPTLQTADIVMYSDPGDASVGAALRRPSADNPTTATPPRPAKALLVPVGEDQVSHVEFSRELVRRFNFFYGMKIKQELFSEAHYYSVLKKLGIAGELTEVIEANPKIATDVGMKAALLRKFTSEIGVENLHEKLGDLARFFPYNPPLVVPESLLTPTPRIPGLDGRKMSKSYNNAITLSESDADIRSKTKVMVTDPARKRRTDPGNPDICPVYDWHKLFSPKETLEWSAAGCRTAAIGCIECKSAMADNLIKWIEPVRDRRLKWEHNQKGVLEILDQGSKKAQESAKRTMERVRNAIFHWPSKRAAL